MQFQTAFILSFSSCSFNNFSFDVFSNTKRETETCLWYFFICWQFAQLVSFVASFDIGYLVNYILEISFMPNKQKSYRYIFNRYIYIYVYVCTLWRRRENSSVGRTFKYHSVQLSDLFGDKQKLKHATEGIIQMLLEHWQAWGISHLTKRPVPLFDHNHGKHVSVSPIWKSPGAALCCSLTF